MFSLTQEWKVCSGNRNGVIMQRQRTYIVRKGRKFIYNEAGVDEEHGGTDMADWLVYYRLWCDSRLQINTQSSGA